MTEAEWLASEVPKDMLYPFRDGLSDRKLRLFACACCRRAWNLFTTRSRRAVEGSERYADGAESSESLLLLQRDTLAAYRAGAGTAAFAANYASYHRMNCDVALTTASNVINARWPLYPATELEENPEKLASVKTERANQGGLVRDIFGNPFRPVAFSPSWRTSTAVALTSQMYESRDFGAMPILGDALQDAGCDSAEVLDHCRGPGPHVRGCWVVDLVLGKE